MPAVPFDYVRRTVRLFIEVKVIGGIQVRPLNSPGDSDQFARVCFGATRRFS